MSAKIGGKRRRIDYQCANKGEQQTNDKEIEVSVDKIKASIESGKNKSNNYKRMLKKNRNITC